MMLGPLQCEVLSLCGNRLLRDQAYHNLHTRERHWDKILLGMDKQAGRTISGTGI